MQLLWILQDRCGMSSQRYRCRKHTYYEGYIPCPVCSHEDKEHFNNLTPAEAERLAVLSEECGEVIQAIGKILRHGYNSKYESGLTNREQLELEIGDVLTVLEMMAEKEDIKQSNVEDRMEVKKEKIKKYLHHQ